MAVTCRWRKACGSISMRLEAVPPPRPDGLPDPGRWGRSDRRRDRQRPSRRRCRGRRGLSCRIVASSSEPASATNRPASFACSIQRFTFSSNATRRDLSHVSNRMPGHSTSLAAASMIDAGSGSYAPPPSRDRRRRPRPGGRRGLWLTRPRTANGAGPTHPARPARRRPARSYGARSRSSPPPGSRYAPTPATRQVRRAPR